MARVKNGVVCGLHGSMDNRLNLHAALFSSRGCVVSRVSRGKAGVLRLP